MKSISGKKSCKIIEKRGWVLKKITGSHHIYTKPEVRQILSIPVHKNQDLKVGTLKANENCRINRSRFVRQSVD